MLNILICGQVRNQEQALAAIEKFAAARADGSVGRIVFSTWIGEIDRYAGLRDALARHNVVTAEAVTPIAFMESQGNYFYQAVQFRNGLEKFAAGDIIFKTRTDIRINAALDIPRFAAFVDREMNKTPAVPILFERPIGASVMNALIPFWIEDRFFYGRCSDLAQMATFSRAGDIIGHREAFIAEARWFGTFFAERFPVIRHVMRINWMLRAYAHNHALSSLFYQQDIIFRCLAVFHYLVKTHFIIGMEPDCFDPGAFAGSPEPMPHPFGAPTNIAETLANRFFRATRASIERDGIDMLRQPEIVDFFRIKINQLQARPEFEGLVQPAYD